MARKNCNLVWQNTSEEPMAKPIRQDISAQAGLISDILRRSSSLESETVVIKLPASIIEDSGRLSSFADNVALLKITGVNVIVVHDHTKLVQETLEMFGIDKKAVSGLDITDHKTSQIVEMVLSGHVNKKIVSQICATGCRAIGISGKDGDLIEAKQKTKPCGTNDKVLEFGFVGEPVTVNPEILMNLSDGGLVTVVSPVAFGRNGATYLLDADMAAAIISSVTAASHLILLTSKDSNVSNFGECTLSELKKEYSTTSVNDQIKHYMEAAISALDNNTEYVHLIDADLKDAILLSIFSNNHGTKVTLG